MDYKQFRKRLCQLTGHASADVDALTDGLALIIRESCSELDSVAIGTFVPVKHKEEVVNDLSTGRKLLVPPEITLEFHPGSMLQKRLRNE